jgi:hypothetical protein
MKLNLSQQGRSVGMPLVLLGALWMTGCSSLTTPESPWKKLPWMGEKEEEPYPNPRKMAVTWTPDVIMRTGSTPTRGFGGRVFFYDEKTRPVPVEGELAIQAFIPGPDGKPVKIQRYGFTAEQFTRHYSQSDLGASYSIWIPWDAVGGEEEKITLIPSFQTKQGKRVNGTASVVLLPGKNKRVDDRGYPQQPGERFAGGNPIGPGSWQGDNATGQMERFRQSGLTTTTIPVQRGGTGPSSAPFARQGSARGPFASQRSSQPLARQPAASPPGYDVQPASATSALPARQPTR